MPEVGLEPTLGCPNWILNPDGEPPNSATVQEIGHDANAKVPVLVPHRSNAAPLASSDFYLSRVVAAWDTLPYVIKTAVIALIEAAQNNAVQHRDASPSEGRADG